MRLVRHGFPLEPVAVLPGRVRNASRLTGSAPFDSRYALRKVTCVLSSSVLSWNVLRKIGVQDLQLLGVDRISAAAWNLAVLNPSQLVILYPEIAFQNLGGSRKAEQGCISFGQSPTSFLWPFILRKS